MQLHRPTTVDSLSVDPRAKFESLFQQWLGLPETRAAVTDDLERLLAAKCLSIPSPTHSAARDAPAPISPRSPTKQWLLASHRSRGTSAGGTSSPTRRSSPPHLPAPPSHLSVSPTSTGAASDSTTARTLSPPLPLPAPAAAVAPLTAVASRTGVSQNTARTSENISVNETTRAPPASSSSVSRSAANASNSESIPRFYFPHGVVTSARAKTSGESARLLRGALRLFPTAGQGLTACEFIRVTAALELPRYWNAALFHQCKSGSVAANERDVTVTAAQLRRTWNSFQESSRDAAAQLFFLLTATNNSRKMVPNDAQPPRVTRKALEAVIVDVVETHPGLRFLDGRPEFQARYVETVLERFMYTVNTSWSGAVSLAELRRSRFVESLEFIESEPDINSELSFFSYEHFYVIYCKFWELDTNHTLVIETNDLLRHSDNALSERIVERILTPGVVKHSRGGREKSAMSSSQMGYRDFIWLLLSEEDKRTTRAIEYWFRCVDVDGDGVLSLAEMEFFYDEQADRLDAMGIEAAPFTDLVCQLLDMMKPVQANAIRLSDVKRQRHLAGSFFNTLINVNKYLDAEQRDPQGQTRDDIDPASNDYVRDLTRDTDWVRYARVEYDILTADEPDELNDDEEEDYHDDDDDMVVMEGGGGSSDDENDGGGKAWA